MPPLANPSTRTQARRQQFLAETACRLVEVDEFCQMLVSNRQLIRLDQPDAMLRGLFDPEQGVRFIVEEEKLNNQRALR